MGRSVRENEMEQLAEEAEGPSSLMLALEVPRAAGEFFAFLAVNPLLGLTPRVEGHPVLVLPGFMASDEWTIALRSYLDGLGYAVHGWQLGRNVGPTKQAMQGLSDQLEEVADNYGEPVSLVGWSLGGIYARELAHRHPDLVQQVIMLASPFRLSDSRQSSVYRLYESQSHLHDPAYPKLPAFQRLASPLEVPCTAIYSRTDGVVHWETCIESLGPRRENIEVLGSHVGLIHNPAVLWAVADRLAQVDEEWKPFKPPRWLRAAYPPPEYADDLTAEVAA